MLKQGWKIFSKKVSIMSWADLTEVLLTKVCYFVELTDVLRILYLCKSWHKCVSFKKVSNGKLYCTLYGNELIKIKSLDRAGKSVHKLAIIFAPKSMNPSQEIIHLATYINIHNIFNNNTCINDIEYNPKLKQQNIQYIILLYTHTLYLIKIKKYESLRILCLNLIKLKSRLIFRWLLHELDHNCFQNSNIAITFFNNILNDFNKLMKSNKGLCKDNIIQSMKVDIEEVRARGLSCKNYWMKSGSLMCNPDWQLKQFHANPIHYKQRI